MLREHKLHVGVDWHTHAHCHLFPFPHSELDYFRTLFGPQILLQLNIAYYLPSIPLLLISGQFDQRLEHRFGTTHCVLNVWVVPYNARP